MIAGTAALGGCAALSGYPQDPQESQTLQQLRSQYFGPDSEADYNKANDATTRQKIRDEIVYNRMLVADADFADFVRDINSTNNGISIGSDLTAFVLNGLGSTTGDAPTKAALAAASGGIIAANGAVNKDLFYQKTIPAIIAQMETDRLNFEKTILTGLGQSDDIYPLGRANLDLLKLYRAGSINAAITNLTQQSSTAQTTAQTQVDNTTLSRSQNSVRIRAWLFPNGILDKDKLTQLRNWIASHAKIDPGLMGPDGKTPIGPDYFANQSDQYETERAEAIAALGIP